MTASILYSYKEGDVGGLVKVTDGRLRALYMDIDRIRATLEGGAIELKAPRF